MAQLGVEIVGSAAGLKAALGESLASVNEWASDVEGASVKVTESFAGISTGALAAAAAQDKLAISVERYGPGTLGAAAATVRYRNEVQSLSKSQLDSAAALGRGLTTYVTLPTVALGYEATKMAMSFEDGMRQIETQVGVSGSELDKLSTGVLNLVKSGQSFGQSATDMAGGLLLIEKDGISGARALDILKASAAGAVVSQSSLATTSNLLTSVLKVYGPAAGSATQAMATLNAIVGSGKLTMDDLNGALSGRLLVTAKALGIPIDQLGAAIDTLTKSGLPASTAATNLASSLTKMGAPTTAATKALAILGLTHDQLASDLQHGGLTSALGDLEKAYDTLRAAQGPVVANQTILNAFGGSRLGAGALALVQAATEYQSSISKIQSESSPATFTQDVANAMDTTTAKLQADKVKIEASMIGLGTAIAPVLASLAGDVTGLVDAFDKLPGPVKDALGVMIGGLAIGGPIILGLVTVTRAVVVVEKGLVALGARFLGLGGEAAAGATAAEGELTGIGVTTYAVTGELTVTGRVLQSLGLSAEEGASVAEANLAAVGAAATTATGQVDGLAAALTGLGAAGIAAGAASAAAVLASSGDAPNVKGIPKLGAEADIAQLAESGKIPSSVLAAAAKAAGISADTPAGNALANPEVLAALEKYALAHKLTTSAALGLGNGLTGPAGTAAGPTLTGPAGVPASLGAGASPAAPLTAAQKLQLELAAHPADVVFLQQKEAADNKGIAWLNQRFAEGKIASAAYLKAIEAIYADRNATEDQITAATNKATATAKKNAKSNFLLPAALLDAVAEAKQTVGNTTDDVKAAEAIRTFTKNLLATHTLNAAGVLAANKELATVAQTISTDTSHFTLPPALALQQAKADALAALDPNLQGPSSLQLQAARDEKEAAEKAIKSHVLTIQGLTDAWNEIAQDNSVISSAQQNAIATYHTASTVGLTAGLDLTRAQRVALEERYAQANAHGGAVPNDLGTRPDSPTTIHVAQLTVTGVQDVRSLYWQLDKYARTKKQRRGQR